MLLVVVPRFVVFFLLDFTERRRSKRLICWRLKNHHQKWIPKPAKPDMATWQCMAMCKCSQLAATIWVSSKAWWWFHSEIRVIRLLYPHSWRILKRRHSVLGCQPLLGFNHRRNHCTLYWRKALPAERMAAALKLVLNWRTYSDPNHFLAVEPTQE